MTLGRAPRNDLSFPEDNGLSRNHIALEREESRWFVSDLGSKNGTFVNGQRLNDGQRHLLEAGDQIAASRILLSFPGARLSERTVVFEPGSFESSSTFNTTLQELLAGKPEAQSAAAQAPSVPDTRGRQWTTPIGALVRAGRELAIRRPLPQLFRVILDLSLEAVNADRGVLMTLEEGELVPQASHGENFVISTKVRDRVLEERASVLVRDTRLDEQFNAQQSIVIQGVQSLMAVPLQTDDRVIGIIYVDTQQFFRTFTQDDLNLLTVMANVAAIRIEHQRLEMVEQAEKLLESELEQAGEIQQRHLPSEAPRIPGLDLAGHNLPSRTVGGDYYDFIPLAGNGIGLVVADVAGKGMPAALLMMSLQARLQILSTGEDAFDDLGVLMMRVNRSMSASCPGNRFVTCFFCTLDPATGRLDYCNAGHNPACVVSVSGTVRTLAGGGPVLGLFAEVPYEEQRTTLERGDTLVLFSDGVTEAENADGEEFGEQRLIDLLIAGRGQPAGRIVEAVTRAVHQFVDGPPQDDLTVLVAVRR